MSIKSICKSNVITIKRNATLHDAARIMKENNVGSIVVAEGSNGKRIPTGIITDRDIALVLGSSQNPKDVKVEQVMKSLPITVNESDGVYETIVKMREFGVKRLPVLHNDGSLFGIICADDLLSLMGEEISNLSQISETQLKNEQGRRLPIESHP